MQIGAMNHPAGDPVAEIDWIGQHGFDFVDFTLEPPAADPDQINAGAIRTALDQHNLGVVAHTAYYLPLASPFGSIRQASLEELQRALKTAQRIGATLLNAHFDKPPKFFSNQQTIEWHVEVLGPLCEQAAEVGVTIVLEHVPFAGNDQLEMIETILEEVPLLRFHLDSGHAKLEREYDRWSDYIDRLGPKLAHVHLSDNDGTSDQHLPLGSAPRSTTDWPEHIRKLKASGYEGTITLEVFAPERDYLLLSRNLLRKWWDDT
jgi:sugar phosphate isomerase/epimerase